jgi:hypothetical protein
MTLKKTELVPEGSEPSGTNFLSWRLLAVPSLSLAVGKWESGTTKGDRHESTHSFYQSSGLLRKSDY